jgi:hypothetical protein
VEKIGDFLVIDEKHSKLYSFLKSLCSFNVFFTSLVVSLSL